MVKTLDKLMESKYSAHCRAIKKADENATPPSYVDFLKAFKEKVESDKIEISAEMKEQLKALGWELKLYTPQSGQNKNVETLYMANSEARTTSGGFLPVNKSALRLLRTRFISNVDAIDAVLNA